MDKLTIGKMAKLNRISEQTLRLYDKLGLLKPSSVNEENGYRCYSIKQCARLDMIQHMKSMGMTLNDIKKLLDKKDVSLIKSILQQKSEGIDNEIKELKFQKRALERTIESYDRYETSPPDGIISIEYIGKRFMYLMDSGINFYDYDLSVYEEILRKLKLSLISDNLPQVYFCNAGTILRKDKLIMREFVSSEVFVFVDKDYAEEELISALPSGMYLCIYCNKFDKEKDYINRLLDYAEEKGYAISGDYICEVLADLPVFEQHERGMFLRLQVPIIIK
ncbi:MAG: helix-turn-helix domain-containing protein [Bacillota bacterium]|nr:helix-turn-helix domain-containing protein [Bacillota bacterium]